MFNMISFQSLCGGIQLAVWTYLWRNESKPRALKYSKEAKSGIGIGIGIYLFLFGNIHIG